jgi:hypothetical protein
LFRKVTADHLVAGKDLTCFRQQPFRIGSAMAPEPATMSRLRRKNFPMRQRADVRVAKTGSSRK